MSMQVTLGSVLIGVAAIATGVVGLRLPPGDRLAAALPLVVGAGVGVVALAVGMQVVSDPIVDGDAVFLVASTLGFVATVACLYFLWLRTLGHTESGGRSPS